ncbi:MAG: ATP-binding cassette domain-containing protein [Chloroflexota bacterium]
MHIVHIHHLTVNFAGREIFSDLNWVIGDRDRIGLVGPNGAGKSSLLKVLVKQVIPDTGQIVTHGNLYIDYLSQDVDLNPTHSLIEAAMVLPPRLAEVEAQLQAVEAKLSDPDVYSDETALSQVLEQQADILERYERLNGSHHASQVRKLLSQLGFTPDDYNLPVSALSGGQKKLVGLVQMAVSSPDILLLDEPDNHLDVVGKRNLERFIAGYQGAVIAAVWTFGSGCLSSLEWNRPSPFCIRKPVAKAARQTMEVIVMVLFSLIYPPSTARYGAGIGVNSGVGMAQPRSFSGQMCPNTEDPTRFGLLS